jgi:hypothetical protein
VPSGDQVRWLTSPVTVASLRALPLARSHSQISPLRVKAMRSPLAEKAGVCPSPMRTGAPPAAGTTNSSWCGVADALPVLGG